jgi:anti-anti-sigma factor
VKIKQQQVGAVTIIKPQGPITNSDAQELELNLKEVIRNTLGRVVLDAAAVSYVDSKGLESLVNISQELSRSGKQLKLCNITETVGEVIDITGLSVQFEQFEDANAAVRSFL